MTEHIPVDEIRISDLRFRCVVGLDDQERATEQDVVVQVVLHVDLRQAGRTDEITDTVDYRAVKREVLSMAERSRFHLIEALAQSIADICLRHDQVRQATITVDKPGALSFARSVGVRIVRSK